MQITCKINIFKRLISALLVVCVILSFASVTVIAEETNTSESDGNTSVADNSNDTDAEESDGDTAESDSDDIGIEPKYIEVSADYGSIESYGLGQNDVVTLKPEDAVSEDAAAKISEGFENYDNGKSVASDKDTGNLSWTFEVSKTGLYEINIDYIPYENDKSDIQRKISIDGILPFRESGNIGFLRKWKEVGKPLKDNNGDEVVPKLEQVIEWSTNKVTDVDGAENNTLRYLLTSGTHTFALEYVNGNLNIGNILIKPASDFRTYEEVKAEYGKKGYKEYTGDTPIRREGETAEYRSGQVLRREANSDPATTPYRRGHLTLNTIGGWNWRKGNQKIEWVIDVPESGLYKLNMRMFQNHGEGLSVYRQLTIEGEVPFEEVADYAFGFDNEWQGETFSDREGNPYLFYLEEGERTVALHVKMGKSAPVINELYDINDDMSQLIRDITKVTGTNPDLNFDYKLQEKVPSLIESMIELRDRYRAQVDYLIENSERMPTLANSLNTAADQLDYLINRPDKIPAKLKQLKTTQSSVSTWFFNIQDQPMAIDYIQFVAPSAKLKLEKSGFIDKLMATIVNFLSSFSKDYDNVRFIEEDGEEIITDVTLDVWVARSKEMCEVLQQMAREEFTPNKKIGVKINVMPGGSVSATNQNNISPLTLAIISGTVPDIALGTDSLTPVELAIREATYDLRQFDDYEEIASRFLPGAIEPMKYKGGVYALPENMDFKMMFYRTDILDEIGVKVPNTWTDLYNEVLPILGQESMEFFMPSDYATFLFQHGGEYYNEDRTKTALDSDVAYQAFLQWTKNYTVYNMPETADVYNHFRIGDIPIIIGGYGDYMKIQYAAPDLYGRWEIAPIPGVLKEDGSIDRTTGGGSSTLCMFTDSKNKPEAWEFAKWWLSSDIQYQFSIEIEAVMGLEARWNTANIEAFLNLPWPEEHANVFEQVWSQLKNQPNTLGGYYVGRTVNNAWTRVVMNDQNPRISFEQAIEEIENEMERKQIEYRLIIKKDE